MGRNDQRQQLTSTININSNTFLPGSGRTPHEKKLYRYENQAPPISKRNNRAFRIINVTPSKRHRHFGENGSRETRYWFTGKHSGRTPHAVANRVDTKIERAKRTIAVETVRYNLAHAIKLIYPAPKQNISALHQKKKGNTKSQGGLSRHTYTLVPTHHGNTFLQAKNFRKNATRCTADSKLTNYARNHSRPFPQKSPKPISDGVFRNPPMNKCTHGDVYTFTDNAQHTETTRTFLKRRTTRFPYKQ